MNYKNKITEEIVALYSTTYSSSGNTVTYYDKSGLPTTISEKQFNEEFEPSIVDYRKYKDNIIEACHLNREFQKLANVVLRRLDPDYLKVNTIVYFEYPECYFDKKDAYYKEYGPERPYKIVKISKDSERKNLSWVCLVRLGKKEKEKDYFNDYNSDFRLPIYLDRLEPNDAHWYIKRYDKAY